MHKLHNDEVVDGDRRRGDESGEKIERETEDEQMVSKRRKECRLDMYEVYERKRKSESAGVYE
jgi:hypothetical protein